MDENLINMKKITTIIGAILVVFFGSSFFLLDKKDLGKVVISAIAKYETLAALTPEEPEIMDSWLPNQGIRPKYAILKPEAAIGILEKAAGVKVFLSGPHANGIDYHANSMGHYNPEFLDMTYAAIKALFATPNFTEDAKTLYQNRFQSTLQTYYAAYHNLHHNYSKAWLDGTIEDYQKYIISDTISGYSVNDVFWRGAVHMKRLGYKPHEFSTAMHFWLRRSIDGTDQHFVSLLHLIFERLDPDFVKFTKLIGPWTNGSERYDLYNYSDKDMLFFGGSVHEGGASFKIRSATEGLLQSNSTLSGWSPYSSKEHQLEVFDYNGKRALVFRDANNVLKGWVRKIKPHEGLYAVILSNKTKHQLSGKYLQSGTQNKVNFAPDDFTVTGLTEENQYEYAIEEDYPTDFIYFANGVGMAYVKTKLGLDLYAAKQEFDFWYKTDSLVTSLVRIEPFKQGDSRSVAGNYPFTSTEILTLDVQNYYTKQEFKIMRNEIFARHGYVFKSPEMKSYFEKQNWYQPKRDDVMNLITPLEHLNIEIINYFEQLK